VRCIGAGIAVYAWGGSSCWETTRTWIRSQLGRFWTVLPYWQSVRKRDCGLEIPTKLLFGPFMFGPRHSLLSCILYRRGRRQRSAMATPDEIVLALDWTPNINHVGFFLAHSRGYFEEAGVKVVFSSPHADDYKTTPAQKVATGEAQVAICPSESVISHACQVNSRLSVCLWIPWHLRDSSRPSPRESLLVLE